jgi:hypothetical protein
LELTLAAAHVSPKDETAFIEELRKYFRKLGISIHVLESLPEEKIIKFKKGLEEEEETYWKFLDVYSSLVKILDKYATDNHEGFIIESDDLIAYVNKSTNLRIEDDDPHFLFGLQWYSHSKIRIGMRFSPLMYMKTMNIKGLALVFELQK